LRTSLDSKKNCWETIAFGFLLGIFCAGCCCCCCCCRRRSKMSSSSSSMLGSRKQAAAAARASPAGQKGDGASGDAGGNGGRGGEGGGGKHEGSPQLRFSSIDFGHGGPSLSVPVSSSGLASYIGNGRGGDVTAAASTSSTITAAAAAAAGPTVNLKWATINASSEFLI